MQRQLLKNILKREKDTFLMRNNGLRIFLIDSALVARFQFLKEKMWINFFFPNSFMFFLVSLVSDMSGLIVIYVECAM